MITINDIKEIKELGKRITYNQQGVIKKQVETFTFIGELMEFFKTIDTHNMDFLDQSTQEQLEQLQQYCRFIIPTVDREIRHQQSLLTRKFNEVEGL
jgi:hypothetical protein